MEVCEMDQDNDAKKINEDSAVSKAQAAESASNTVDKISKDSVYKKEKFTDGITDAVDSISENSTDTEDKAAEGPGNIVNKNSNNSAAAKNKIIENTIGDKDNTINNTVVAKSKDAKNAFDDEGKVFESTYNCEAIITEDTNGTQGKINKDIEHKENNEELIGCSMLSTKDDEGIDTRDTDNDNKIRMSIDISLNKVEKDPMKCLESGDKSSEMIKSTEYITNDDKSTGVFPPVSASDYSRKSYEKVIINKEHNESTNTKTENTCTANFTSFETPECMKEGKGYQNNFERDVDQKAQDSKNIESEGILSVVEVGPPFPENTKTEVDEEASCKVSGDADGLMELIEGVASDLLETDEVYIVSRGYDVSDLDESRDNLDNQEEKTDQCSAL
ncbi:uncharacterized protein LOC143222714 [Tachypleus tridentatus]|uniref:uncharacterized protein LOC143222714 n=1 Tax=Tachypleus tridentatus TaxID=6853 RepID=UPI003FCFA5E4